jgi:hypothetical protein
MAQKTEKSSFIKTKRLLLDLFNFLHQLAEKKERKSGWVEFVFCFCFKSGIRSDVSGTMFNRTDTRSRIHPKRYTTSNILNALLFKSVKHSVHHARRPSITSVGFQTEFAIEKSHSGKIIREREMHLLHGGRGTFFDAIKIGRVGKIDTKEN